MAFVAPGTCPEGFRSGAVELVRSGGRLLARIVKDLGVHASTLRNWATRAELAQAVFERAEAFYNPSGGTAEYGLGPKEAARVARLGRAVAFLRADPARSLADLAQDCAFSDQAHLSREWRSFTGLSPTGWLRGEEFPFVQDEEEVPMTGSGT